MTLAPAREGAVVATPALPSLHGLGFVANDWEAAQVWLDAIASRGRRNSPETIATYGYHLAKLRWFCENVHGVQPSRWTVQDVNAFYAFLENLPDSALCAVNAGERRYASTGGVGHTPFRTRPSRSSRADIQRCVHAMFRAWREMGYIHINPMGLHGAGTVRKVKSLAELSRPTCTILSSTRWRPRTSRPLAVASRMSVIDFSSSRFAKWDCARVSWSRRPCLRSIAYPIRRMSYWIMLIREETSKGRKERKVPVSRAVLEALEIYREAFGLPALPDPMETGALVLSPRTSRLAVTVAGSRITDVQSRRFFQAWRPVATRHGLYHIVKGRLAAVPKCSTARETAQVPKYFVAPPRIGYATPSQKRPC